MIIEDFESHGYELDEFTDGEFVFIADKKEYFKRLKTDPQLKELHQKHPIWFDDDSKNVDEGIEDGKSVVIIKTMCARHNIQMTGNCPICKTEVPVPTAKPHIPWKHELGIEVNDN